MLTDKSISISDFNNNSLDNGSSTSITREDMEGILDAKMVKYFSPIEVTIAALLENQNSLQSRYDSLKAEVDEI